MRIARLSLVLCLLASPLSSQLRLTGPVIHVNGTGEDFEPMPQVAMAPSGDFLIVWGALLYGAEEPDSGIASRLYRRNGVPAGEPRRIEAEDPDFPYQLYPKVAARAGEGFTTVWANADRIPCLGICDPPFPALFGPMSVRPLGPAGEIQEGPFRVASNDAEYSTRHLVGFPSGEALALWGTWISPSWSTYGQRLNTGGRPASGVFELASADPDAMPQGAAGLADGGLLVLYRKTPGTVFVQRYGASGEPAGAATPVLPRPRNSHSDQIAAQEDGSFVVGWSAPDLPLGPADGVFLRFFGPSVPSGLVRVPAPNTGRQILQALVADGKGDVLVIWYSAQDHTLYAHLYDRQGRPKGTPVRIAEGGRRGPFDVAAASDGRGDWVVVWTELSNQYPFFRVFAQRLTESCAAGPTTACLADGRFRVEVSWKDHGGRLGEGQARPLTDDTAAFWFFTEDNFELVVKALDGRPYNGHFWVFSAGLTDVEFDLRVTDTVTGEERVYHNPARTLSSRADIRAFADPGPTPAAGAGRRAIAGPSHPSIPCAGGEHVLCLQRRLFRAEVEFVDPRTGERRRARAVPLTDESGAFWFFEEENIELFVKVLDGRAHNGHFWVFHGALSDVEYTLAIIDEVDGHRYWTYHNPRGRLRSGADTRAFR